MKKPPKPGDTVSYVSYGQRQRGVVSHIGPRSGIIFLTNGQFIFPEGKYPTIVGVTAEEQRKESNERIQNKNLR